MMGWKPAAALVLWLYCAQGALGNNDSASLKISVAGGAFNSKFKFYDASEGCPGYNDIPGAKDFLGGVFASDKGASKTLPTGIPLQVFLFRPRDTPGISAGGGAREIRRRALQFVLTDDATLEFTGFEDHVPSWTASGGITVESAEACADGDDPAVDEDAENDQTDDALEAEALGGDEQDEDSEGDAETDSAD